MKILVSGDREWDDIETIHEVLRHFPPGTILIHGDARGADTIAKLIGEELGFDVRAYPYLSALGRAGGPARNTQMAQENPDIEEVIGFSKSKGTKDMLYRVCPKYLKDARVRLVTSTSSEWIQNAPQAAEIKVNDA